MGAKSDPNVIGAVHQATPGDGSGSLVVEGTASGRAVGGSINFTDSVGLLVAEVDCTAALAALQAAGADIVANAVAGLGPAQKIARGIVTLGGSNPTAIATGLATVVSAQVMLVSTATPGLDPADFTIDFANVLGNALTAGLVNLYAWKYTSNANPTLIASTNNAAIIAWIAVGT
jgi:hypothetical protein